MATTTKTRPASRVLLAPEIKRAFLSRGTDLLYRAKRLADGQVIAEGAEKCAVKHEAEQRGYSIY